MWQNGFKREFNKYVEDFENNFDGLLEEFPVENIDVPVSNVLVQDNQVCDPAVNEAILDRIPNSDWVIRLTDGSITHSTIWAANDKPFMTDLLKILLE